MAPAAVPTMFIGSSAESKVLTEELTARLRAAGIVEVLPWYDAFELGYATVEDLVRRLDEVDFAAFFLTADDRLDHRGVLLDAPRDNVVFELGLFMGRLNRDRAFLLTERKPERPEWQVKIPSDLAGVMRVMFTRQRLAETAERLLKAMNECGPKARVPRNAHFVESGREGRDVHQTIGSAVRVARPGDVILVRPGTYAEQLVIDKPLEIVGVGVVSDDQEAVLCGQGAAAVHYEAARGVGRISALTIESGGDEDCASIDITKGYLVVDGCRITTRGSAEASVRVRCQGRARIVDNRISNGTGTGVLVCEFGRADITSNVVTGHAHTCVEMRDGARVHLVDNRIGQGISGGVLIRGPITQPLVERNDIFENREAGVAILDGARPVVQGNRIHDGFGPGVSIEGDSAGTVQDNDLYGNRGSAVQVGAAGRPLVTRNRIYNGAGGGVLVTSGGRARVDENEIRGNARAGVAFMRGATPEVFIRNVIVDGRAEGVYDEIGMRRDGNDVDRNAGGNWRTGTDSE
jgi:nitrous oxidase accessory protein NosD